MRPLKIGVDATCWANKRGYGRFTRELLEALVRLDQTNEYFFFVDNETAAEHDLPESVHTVIAQTTVSPSRAAAAGGNRSLTDIWSMSRAVMRQPVDIFFFPTMYSYFPIFNRIKIVVTLHDLIADNYPELTFPDSRSRFFWRLKQKIAIWQASTIATVSEYSKSQIADRFRLPKARLRVIPEAARSIFCETKSGRERDVVLERYGLNDDDHFLLYVGGISPHKNLERLVEAFDRVRQTLPRTKLVLVGDYKDDPFLSAYPKLRSQVESLGISDSVIFTGFVSDEDLLQLYNAATLVVLPSLDEGFGLPAIEAISCGTPVAASNCGSLPEVLGDSGVYFDPLKPEDMASAIESLLNDPDRRNELRARGLARSSLFRWERAASETLSIFNELGGLTPHHG